MTLSSFHETRETLKRELTSVERVKVLVNGARAAISQNAIFPSDLRITIEWLSKAKQIVDAMRGLGKEVTTR